MKAVFERTGRRVLLSPWLWLILLFPAGMSFFPAVSYEVIYSGLFLAFLLPFSALYFGILILGEEIGGGMLPYLLGRPVRRADFFLAKFLGTFLPLGALLTLSFAAVLLTRPQPPAVILCDAFGILAGSCAYTALAALIGMALKKPFFFGLLILFGWENLFGWLPGFLKRFTLLFHLRALTGRSTEIPGFSVILATNETKAVASAFILFYIALFFGLSCFLLSRMEGSPRDTAAE